MNNFIRILIMVSILSLLINTSVFAQDDEIVTNIGDKTITVADIERLISYFDTERQMVLEKNPQLKQSLLQQLVHSIVISDLAKKSGFDQKPEIREQMTFFLNGFISNEYLKREIIDNITVPESEMKSYYESHQEEFKLPEMVRARHILIKVDMSLSDKDKETMKKKAENILQKIKEGDDFSKIANEFSDDQASKVKGGDLGFFSKGRMVKSFEDAVFSLKKNEVSDIVETQYGYHIIKAEERKEPSIEPFDSAKDKIKLKLIQDLTRSKINEFIDKAMKDAQVEMHPEKLLGIKN